MITKKVIDAIYKKYKKRPASTDDLNIVLLFEAITPQHGVEIDGDEIVISSIDPMSPFHRIPLFGINAIVEFDAHVAIVMHSSIIFLNKEDNSVSVHIKQQPRSITNRIFGLFGDRALASMF